MMHLAGVVSDHVIKTLYYARLPVVVWVVVVILKWYHRGARIVLVKSTALYWLWYNAITRI